MWGSLKHCREDLEGRGGKGEGRKNTSFQKGEYACMCLQFVGGIFQGIFDNLA